VEDRLHVDKAQSVVHFVENSIVTNPNAIAWLGLNLEGSRWPWIISEAFEDGCDSIPNLARQLIHLLFCLW
jgi:hypothetical protein